MHELEISTELLVLKSSTKIISFGYYRGLGGNHPNPIIELSFKYN